MRDLHSRRSLMLGSASALAAAGIATPTVAAAMHADAELVRLVDLIVAAQARRVAFDEEAEAALDRIESVPIPEALEHQRDIDYPIICCDQGRCAEYRFTVDGPWRPIYETPDALSAWAQRWLRGDGASLDVRYFTDEHHARMREIAAGFERWNSDRDRAEAAAGYTAPAAAARHETGVIDELLRQIAVHPARTSEGLTAKVRAAMVAGWFHLSSGERELLEMMKKPKPNWDKAFMTSLCIDASSVGDGALRDRHAA